MDSAEQKPKRKYERTGKYAKKPEVPRVAFPVIVRLTLKGRKPEEPFGCTRAFQSGAWWEFHSVTPFGVPRVRRVAADEVSEVTTEGFDQLASTGPVPMDAKPTPAMPAGPQVDINPFLQERLAKMPSPPAPAPPQRFVDGDTEVVVATSSAAPFSIPGVDFS